jgi:hypothetical protein
MDPDPLTNIDPDPGQPTASRSGSKTLVCGFSTQMFLRGRILTVDDDRTIILLSRYLKSERMCWVSNFEQLFRILIKKFWTHGNVNSNIPGTVNIFQIFPLLFSNSRIRIFTI